MDHIYVCYTKSTPPQTNPLDCGAGIGVYVVSVDFWGNGDGVYTKMNKLARELQKVEHAFHIYRK